MTPCSSDAARSSPISSIGRSTTGSSQWSARRGAASRRWFGPGCWRRSDAVRFQAATVGPACVITPGSRPLTELASALSVLVGRSTSDVLDDLETDPGALARLAQDAVPAGARLVVVVDQLEELFTQTRDEIERRKFFAVLVAAVSEHDGSVTTIVALRADFYGHCSASPELAGLLDGGSTLLCPMEPEEIRAAVDGPAELAGLEVQPGLTELILRDVGDEPGALPLLSHALLETWKRRSGRTLTVSGYRAAGGVHGAIAQTAESVYRSLDADHQRRARRIFLRLTELGDGTEDTSRRVVRDELLPAGDAADVEALLLQLAAARAGDGRRPDGAGGPRSIDP